MTWTAQAQPLFLAGILGWSGLAKATGGDPQSRVAGTALHRLLGGRLATTAYLALGITEAVLALALLTAPGRLVASATVALTLGFLGYLTYSAFATPEASCGCLGNKK